MKEGSFESNYTTVATGAVQVDMSGDRIAVLYGDGALAVKEGALDGPSSNRRLRLFGGHRSAPGTFGPWCEEVVREALVGALAVPDAPFGLCQLQTTALSRERATATGSPLSLRCSLAKQLIAMREVTTRRPLSEPLGFDP